ncbi:MAG: hypothetical protein R3E86_18330 [Pseudomonadales bacterium]
MVRTGILFAIVVLAAACSSSNAPAPTHYWESSNATTKARYSLDNQACENQAAVGESGVMKAQTDSFDAYRECMTSKGYVLRTY